MNEIASATSRPESVSGLHFFSPANVMKLLEVVRAATSRRTRSSRPRWRSPRRFGKIPASLAYVRVSVGNRILAMRRIEADAMSLEGATPAQVDDALFDLVSRWDHSP